MYNVYYRMFYNITVSYFEVLLDLLSWEHWGQYHLPFGFDVSPTHWKWNHSIGH